MSIGPLNRRSSGLPSLWRALLELLVACQWVWAAMVAGRISIMLSRVDMSSHKSRRLEFGESAVLVY